MGVGTYIRARRFLAFSGPRPALSHSPNSDLPVPLQISSSSPLSSPSDVRSESGAQSSFLCTVSRSSLTP